MPGLPFTQPRVRSVVCYHCGRPQDVGVKAQTLTCRHCHKPLQVGDVKVTGYDARRRVQTTGTLRVEKKGQIVADSVECGDLIVRGQLTSKRDIVSTGGVELVGPKAVVNGNLRASRVKIDGGASWSGHLTITPPPPPPQAAEETAAAPARLPRVRASMQLP